MAVIVDDSVIASLSNATEMLAFQLMKKEEEEENRMTGEQQRQIRSELNGMLDNRNEMRRLDDTIVEEELW